MDGLRPSASCIHLQSARMEQTICTSQTPSATHDTTAISTLRTISWNGLLLAPNNTTKHVTAAQYAEETGTPLGTPPMTPLVPMTVYRSGPPLFRYVILIHSPEHHSQSYPLPSHRRNSRQHHRPCPISRFSYPPQNDHG